MNIVCKMLELRLNIATTNLSNTTRSSRKKYKLKKVGKEKEKIVGNLKALVDKIQELKQAKAAKVQTAKDNIKKMKSKAKILQSNLNASKAQSQRNFKKWEGWQRNATK